MRHFIKSLIIFAILFAAWCGINYANLSKPAVQRMVKRFYIPEHEYVDKLCSFLRPDTQISVESTLNGKVVNTANVKNPEELCKYWKSVAHNQVEWQTTYPTVTSLEQVKKIPFNQAVANIESEIHYGYTAYEGKGKSRQQVHVTTTIKRLEKIHYRRGFMGSYEYLSYEVKDDVKIPHLVKNKRKAF